MQIAWCGICGTRAVGCLPRHWTFAVCEILFLWTKAFGYILQCRTAFLNLFIDNYVTNLVFHSGLLDNTVIKVEWMAREHVISSRITQIYSYKLHRQNLTLITTNRELTTVLSNKCILFNLLRIANENLYAKIIFEIDLHELLPNPKNVLVIKKIFINLNKSQGTTCIF